MSYFFDSTILSLVIILKFGFDYEGHTMVTNLLWKIKPFKTMKVDRYRECKCIAAKYRQEVDSEL